jgi:DNA mismatch repair protein MutL
MKIKKLSSNLIKKIAAGEVISRPANALKELIENSIDAQASKINIYIEKGGLSLIKIKDNGLGIEKEDLEICTQMHTTSKTSEEETFFGCNSFGFRGEALASIDAISKLKIESHENCLCEGKMSASNVSLGTNIEIYDIFSKIPGRSKFLKNEKIEWEKIKTLIQKYIIKYENIAWEVYHNEKNIYKFNSQNTKQRIEEIFQAKAYEIKAEYENYKISGYFFEQNTQNNHKILFINNRPVKDIGIFGYLKNTLKEYFAKDKEPSFYLDIEMPSDFIDCNVHPSKDEVRIVNYTPVFKLISKAITHKVFIEINQKENLETNMSSSIEFSNAQERFSQDLSIKPFNNEFNAPYLGTLDNFLSPKNSILNESTYAGIKSIKKEIDSIFQEDLQKDLQEEKSYFKILGQIKKTYILFENEKGFGMLDQHAAHERIVYEKMKKDLKKTNAQKLLSPIDLDLNEEQKEKLNEITESLDKKGFIIENYKITHLPIILIKENLKTQLEKALLNYENFDIFLERFLADIACKNALKSNTYLSYQQMEEILSQAMKHVPYCNHGRPTFKYIELKEIQKWFERSGY